LIVSCGLDRPKRKADDPRLWLDGAVEEAKGKGPAEREVGEGDGV
jgi:hypothetical protein